MTNLIAENAWKLFLEIEDQGGFLACLKSGFIQTKLSESGAKRRNDLATRKTILLGTNQYPDTHEKISETVDLKKLFDKRLFEPELIVEPITLFRGSEQYDKLRIAVDRAARRPVVFLLPIGNPAMSKARSQFSANFFGCVGYQIIDNQRFINVDDSVKRSIESKPDIVVICSSDEEYPLIAHEIFMKLKDVAIVVVAGNPACREELKSKGIENFIHLRSNLIETLEDFNKQLGIKNSDEIKN